MKKPFNQEGFEFPVNLVNSTPQSILGQIDVRTCISGAHVAAGTSLSQTSVTTAQEGCQLYFEGIIDCVDKNNAVYSNRVLGCYSSNYTVSSFGTLIQRFCLLSLKMVRNNLQISCCKEDHTIIDMCLFTAGTIHPSAYHMFTHAQ